ncbi:phytochelatin synthase family protein [Planctomycetes bacterium TBK1r]|uniref:glutathione gamma-glutamylcysteinyltransferase n=1 Tax=Stieleria magnilauensis TaxID=2527963 RepID=A0ABX5XUU6_9BACT|nr:Phytochelatin synthase [Planctomycetes bacterium TBK1r]
MQPNTSPQNVPIADIVYTNCQQGADLFDHADIKPHFWSLCRSFVSEEFMTYCGIASAVTALNSLCVPAPDSPQIYPYKVFTQDNFFTDDVLHFRRPIEVEKHGNTLAQLATMLSLFAVTVDVIKADELSVDECRMLLVGAVGDPSKRVIVDFDRRCLGQKGHGHFSPLAAFHSQEDMFLLMDVARYKLPPCWVRHPLLHSSMVTVDSSSETSRGFLVLTSKE